MRRVFWFSLLSLAAVALAATALAGPGASKRPRNGPYFSVVPDLRLCPSPSCGGFWVSAVNREVTRCADRSRAPSCYVVDIDWTRSRLDEGEIAQLGNGELIVRGRIRRANFEPFGKLGVFRAVEGLRAVGARAGLPLGGPPQEEGEIYARLHDTGIRCITTPCPSFDVSPLNRRRRERQQVDSVDLSGVEATERELQAAADALFTRRGLLALGRLETVEVPVGPNLPAGTSTTFIATVFFLPPEPSPR